jgi:two-component system, NtrC family, sensor kinase
VIESANVIAREAQRIARIVRSLLGFARRKGPEGEPCDVAETVERCIALLRPIAEKANLEFSLESARDCRASIDQDSLQQVTTNLLSNAIQAMTSGGSIQLKVTSVVAAPPKPLGAAAGSCIRLDVADHGIGIAPEVLPHIFEPFFSTKGPSDGTGLGLSVVYGIVEDHHGFISVESTVDKGSVFSVFLPKAGAP